MKFKKKSFLFSISLLICLNFIFSSCTCKIKEDQLAKLAELRRQEKSLNSEIAEKQNTKAKIDKEIQARTAEYNDCNGRREVVKQRLSV